MSKLKNKKLMADASWHTPTLGIDCPKCGEWNDYYKQFKEMEYPFEICQSAERPELEDIEFECPECKTVFELERVEW